jgi:hypothetical protein
MQLFDNSLQSSSHQHCRRRVLDRSNRRDGHAIAMVVGWPRRSPQEQLERKALLGGSGRL